MVYPERDADWQLSVSTHLLCSKQRDPVFNAGKNQRLFYGSIAWQLWELHALIQPSESQYTPEAQWFSVPVRGECILKLKTIY